MATLCSVYHDQNKSTKACEELRAIIYNPASKVIDINRFINKINTLYNTANILVNKQKSTLLEYLPTHLDNRLLSDSKDPEVLYKAFQNRIADAALL